MADVSDGMSVEVTPLATEVVFGGRMTDDGSAPPREPSYCEPLTMKMAKKTLGIFSPHSVYVTF